MSSENVALVRRGYEAVLSGDVAALRLLLHPDVVWHGGDPSWPLACHNREDVFAFIEQARKRGRIGELVDVIDAGEKTVVVLRPGSPDRLTSELRAQVTTIRDGQVVEMIAYESPEAALAAARG